MEWNDVTISRAILKRFSDKLNDCLESDVAIIGAGPAGLICAWYLAKEGFKVTVFERHLSVGGGMWGGGIMMNEIVVGEDCRPILDELGIPLVEFEESGYLTADSVLAVTTIASKAMLAGARIFNLISAEDVAIDGDKVTGIVLNWSAVDLAGFHVDPITMYAKVVVEASGHPCEIARLLEKKTGFKLFTSTGGVVGEGSMNASAGEKTVVENTKEFYKNCWVVGMAANAVFGAPRMGPVFGGMILSGMKAGKEISERLKS